MFKLKVILFFIILTSFISIALSLPSPFELKNDDGYPINGDTNEEIFQKYKCRVCDDIMVDNVELVDGELVINEKLGVKICDTFFSKILHNSFGGIICHTVVQAKLDEIIKAIVSSGSANKISDQVCKAIHFCE
uniref:Saposin B-type domain-containing protein n=1 Tax=Caenorhabditis japonica TaxID=281687 RepID=A0A8R1IFT1_CAEJA